MAETAQIIPSAERELDIRILPGASAKMAELMRDADSEFTCIRVFVAGGGCGGMGYGMTFSEGTSDYDHVIEADGVKVAVDAVALNYLRGAEIDFSGNSFVFNNVFQSVGGSGTCGGCGASGGGGGGGGGGGCGA
jgi:iron-sulfur cluster insertion protein